MIDYDLHIHTEHCGHAPQMLVEKIIERADKLNLKTIAITTHIYSPKELAIIEKIRNEVATAKSNCKVIVGAEVDVDGLYCDGRLVTDKLDKIDYLVAGFHYTPGLGNYPHCQADCPLPPQEMFDRWKSSLLGIVSNNKIHTLAHPVRLIAICVDFGLFFEKALDVFSQAAEISAKNKIAWEINEMTGYKIPNSLKHYWPKVFQVALDAGVKLIYGSDAHELKSIGVTDFTRLILNGLPNGSLLLPHQIGL